jgi:hypothetical protein
MAYRAVAVEKMLQEVNLFSDRLQLPTPHPIRMPDLTSTYVFLPREGLNGVMTTENSYFSIDHGVLWCFSRLSVEGKESVVELFPKLIKTPSLVDSNSAYSLATQWLSAISMDVPALEHKYQPSVSQWFFYGKPEDLPKDVWSMPSVVSTNVRTMLPIFDVVWGKGDSPPVKLTILGWKRELLSLRLEDKSFSRRPVMVITNAAELNAMPDPPVAELRSGRNIMTNPVSPVTSTNRPPPFHRAVESH